MPSSKRQVGDGPRYNQIGSGYALNRREDPNLYETIINSLGACDSIINIGAGTGSYEPRNRNVIAIEPSDVMIRQRPFGSAIAIKATADQLPFHDKSLDAAMTVLSIHHWHPDQKKGIEEMRRVARQKLVIVTIDPRVSGRMWLLADYLPEVAELDRQIFPLPEAIGDWIGATVKIETHLVKRDTPDWTLMSFWAHPDRVLDPRARATTSGFARQPKHVVERVVSDIERDLHNGDWDRKYGHLRRLNEFDAGLRVITASFDA